MNKNLLTRINKTNRLIKHTIENDYRVCSYFGGTWPIVMDFKKEIRITKRYVIVEYIDYNNLPVKDMYRLSNEFDIQDLRYSLTCINRAIKKENRI